MFRATLSGMRASVSSTVVTVVITLVTLGGLGLPLDACSTPAAVADASAESGSAADATVADAAVDVAPSVDSSVPDASPSPDGATVDAGPDGGFVCGALGGTYPDAVKPCTSASDCAMIARGCYCGSQPVIGIAKAHLAAAEACEAAARSSCALGCPNAPGRVADDGRNDLEGGTIAVACDLGKCHTLLP